MVFLEKKSISMWVIRITAFNFSGKDNSEERIKKAHLDVIFDEIENKLQLIMVKRVIGKMPEYFMAWIFFKIWSAYFITIPSHYSTLLIE